MKEKRKAEPAIVAVVMKAMIASYALTAIMLLILAALVYKLNMKESGVEVGILVIYIAATFFGGFLAGKMGKNKRFIWGLGIGCGYVAELLGVSVCMNGGIDGTIGSCLVRFVMCAGSGMLGGMLS